jgi:6-phosphogluconolactonase (cycloisomerase 2 family)
MKPLARLAQISLGLTILATFSCQLAFAQDDLRQGAVYVQTDGTLGNQVLAFFRHADGTLTPAGQFATGGMGTGADLVSAGSVTLATISGNQFLYVVNTASNDISVFSVQSNTLTFVQRVASGVVRPVSTAVHGNLLYVAGPGSGTVTGFTIDSGGRLTQIPGSTRLGTGGTAALLFQALFDNTGRVLAVVEENTNLVDTFVVDQTTGLLSQQPIQNNADGINPFGMAFDVNNHLFVTAGGFNVPNVSDMSSFSVGPGGVLQAISPNVLNGRQFECWVAITTTPNSNGNFYAYTDNTGDNTISSYLIKPDGTLTLQNSVVASEPILLNVGAGLVDNAISPDNKYLYTTNFGGHVSAWTIQSDGGLVLLQQQSIPVGSGGMALR